MIDPPPPTEDLSSRLSHMSASIVASVRQIPSWQLDLTSVREVRVSSENEEASAALQSQLFIITRKADGSLASAQRVVHDGEELVPYRLLPDDSGVEMRGQYICEYRSASDEYAAKDKKEREDTTAHCKRLLVHLPVDLRHSRTPRLGQCGPG